MLCLFILSTGANEIITRASVSDESDDGKIEITAATSKIKWEDDIIRSWDASGGVEITYSRGGRSFSCTSEKALYTREGEKDDFKDKIYISGDIRGILNGINLVTSQLSLESDEESYKVESTDRTIISDKDYSIETSRLIFNASNGEAQFPDGATFTFTMNSENEGKLLPFNSNEKNFFGQCLRFDTTGGIIIAPHLDVRYLPESNQKFRLINALLPLGAKLYPLNQASSDVKTVLEFKSAEIDFENSKLTASEGISISNGACMISCNKFTLNWASRNMTLESNIILEQESVRFNSGFLEINWDKDGRISLLARGHPQMTINLPETTAEEILKGSKN